MVFTTLSILQSLKEIVDTMKINLEIKKNPEMDKEFSFSIKIVLMKIRK